ncbi:MAG: autotransporter outer membrane beta-barrel domain-containing protein, partial [Psychrobacter sp.]
DISKGTLMVNASNAVQNLTGSPRWNNVVSANGLNSKFSAINDNSPLVGFVADYSDANTVHLKMTAPVVPPIDPVDPPVTDTTFVKVLESQTNQTALGLAGVLDQAIQDRVNNGNNALADALISNTLNFNNSKLAAATNELQPLLMGATNRIITDTNYAATEAVTERSLSKLNHDVWAKIIGSDSSHDEEGGITGYDADSYGAIVGIDTPINDSLSLGVAFSYIDSDVDSNSRTLNHEMAAKNWQILGYGNYAASESTQVNFHAGAGSSDVKGQRHITILTNATAESDYSADTLQAGFGIGHRIGNDLRNFTPFAQMNYARAESDGYRETGAGVYNLEVDENTYESLRWTAGVKMSQALTPKLALIGQLAAAIENGDRRSDITASFIGIPDANFTTIGQEIGREIGIVGIGLSYMPTVNTKLTAGYRGEWRDNYNDQGASIALKTTF